MSKIYAGTVKWWMGFALVTTVVIVVGAALTIETSPHPSRIDALLLLGSNTTQLITDAEVWTEIALPLTFIDDRQHWRHINGTNTARARLRGLYRAQLVLNPEQLLGGNNEPLTEQCGTQGQVCAVTADCCTNNYCAQVGNVNNPNPFPICFPCGTLNSSCAFGAYGCCTSPYVCLLFETVQNNYCALPPAPTEAGCQPLNGFCTSDTDCCDTFASNTGCFAAGNPYNPQPYASCQTCAANQQGCGYQFPPCCQWFSTCQNIGPGGFGSCQFGPNPPPTGAPTGLPTRAPTQVPSLQPTPQPSPAPTPSPTAAPTEMPTEAPTTAPTNAPTESPTEAPTEAPTAAPTESPTQSPTLTPTNAPTESPSQAPTKGPTAAPTRSPTAAPTQTPTWAPTAAPTACPSTLVLTRLMKQTAGVGPFVQVGAPTTVTPLCSTAPTQYTSSVEFFVERDDVIKFEWYSPCSTLSLVPTVIDWQCVTSDSRRPPATQEASAVARIYPF